MDWPLNDPEFFEEDLENVFIYQARRSKAIYRFEGDNVRNCSKKYLHPRDTNLQHGLGTRDEPPNKQHNPANLEYLPFTRASFERIITAFPLHGETTRIINRSDMAFFTDINLLSSPVKALCKRWRSHPGCMWTGC
ncbi:uncharacterized protein THITE_2054949 [Thermothielavioides terrestris NRRL 8126]|uniref:Uncharacterized protein n=1 Tax=Thermothielavioides terrestris (strain ATCC 38088 / NRRL 8126) TaxID=578455 RepID=G2RB84_THETT|nr:uncharacterized protein THITE_2054949 [Thermothielavioides terrestris NRRL 8126]AEO69055.1 hypothetical protein THITE_2054949 [Thermothielavioides terrestris NRRL 8126]